MTKDKVLETVNNLPQEFDLDEFIERLIFVDKVEKGFQQLDREETKTSKEAKNIIRS